MRGFSAANPGKKIGIINIDAHYDRPGADWGPHNGTPFRQLLKASGQRQELRRIRIHGFMNASYYRPWADEQGVTTITGRDVHKRGMETVSSRPSESPAMART